jgi:cytochrome P450
MIFTPSSSHTCRMISRKPNLHLAFSAGDHACVGRHLARLEISMIVNAVMRCTPDIQVAGPHELIISSNHSEYRMLPVRTTPNNGRALEL